MVIFLESVVCYKFYKINEKITILFKDVVSLYG